MKKNKITSTFSTVFEHVFQEKTPPEILKKLAIWGLYFFILTAAYALIVPEVFDIGSYWRERALMNISRLSLLCILLNYVYILFAYGVYFLKIALTERDKFDHEHPHHLIHPTENEINKNR